MNQHYHIRKTIGHQNIFQTILFSLLSLLISTGEVKASACDSPVYNYCAGTYAGLYSANVPTTTTSVFVGRLCGYYAQGTDNTFVGDVSGYNNTGSNNTFLGSGSGTYNSSGSHNTFVGYNANHGILSESVGSENTMIGAYCGSYNKGEKNTFVGYRSGYSNTTGSDNVLVGYQSGYSHTTAEKNVFIGGYGGYSNSTGNNSVFVGYQSGYNNTSDGNTFLGYQSGYSNASQIGNVCIGYRSGYNSASNYNTLAGYQSGYSQTTGGGNTFIGYESGYSNQTGSSNIFIGYKSGYYETDSNKLYIENSDTSTYPLIYGDFSNGTVSINTKYTGTEYKFYVNGSGYTNSYHLTTSDGRLKKNVISIKKAIKKIMKLHGVTYEWVHEKFPKYKFARGRQIGLIAQQVEKILPEVITTDKNGIKGITYGKLIVIATEAIKEQQKIIQKRAKIIHSMRKELDNLMVFEQIVRDLKHKINALQMKHSQK